MRTNGTLRMLVAGAAGTVTYFVIVLITRAFPRRSVLEPNHLPAGPIYRLPELMSSPYVLLPVFAMWVFLAVSKRDQPKTWISAFLAGYVLPFILLHWVLRWI